MVGWKKQQHFIMSNSHFFDSTTFSRQKLRIVFISFLEELKTRKQFFLYFLTFSTQMNTLPIFLDNWVLRSKWCAYVTSDNSTGNTVRKGSIWKWLEARLWETQTFIIRTHCISNVWNVVLLYFLLIWLWLQILQI